MMGGSTMGLFWIWPVLVVIGLALLGYLAYRLVNDDRGTRPGSASGPSSARQILEERYARGEIDEQEFHKRRDGLA